MNWQGGRRSDNIEDQRGQGYGRPLAVGGGLVGLVAAVIVYLFGGNPGDVVVDRGPSAQLPSGSGPQAPGTGGSGPSLPGTGGSGMQADRAQEPLKDFVSVILADTEDTWPALLAPQGVRYVDPHLVLFSDEVQSACGAEESAVGPFYCPRDQRVYLDLSFFQELEQRFGAPGEFARAYVIAHEVGHHVQNLLGITERLQENSPRSRRDANAQSVLTELQADCFAGIWAHHAQQQRHILEQGDIEAGLNAAAAIGDDTLQRETQGRVVPETFTHGSSAQRVAWFRRGLERGTLEACDTFGAARGR